jgi:hypothetical protein
VFHGVDAGGHRGGTPGRLLGVHRDPAADRVHRLDDREAGGSPASPGGDGGVEALPRWQIPDAAG